MMQQIKNMARKQPERNEGDYLQDGLLHCGKCHTPKQTRVEICGEWFAPACKCKCKQEQLAAEQARFDAERQQEKLRRMKRDGLKGDKYREYTFARDDGRNPQMERARKFCENWEQVYSQNIGMLLWGDNGTGKSFFAGCIANCLLDRGVPALMTNFSTILNALQGFSADKNEYINSLSAYKLLVIDDFGIERETEWTLENVFNVVDSRTRSGKPVIFTTNLSLEEIENPKDRAHKRIYDRVMEMTAPIKFTGESRRSEIHKDKLSKAKQLLF